MQTDFSSTAEVEPLLMLHCSLSSKAQWRQLITAFGPDCQVIAVDLLGYGEHREWQPGKEFSLREEAEFVHAQVAGQVAPSTRMHVIGHSYGAALAIQYAALFASNVKSLVLYEPVCFGLVDESHAELAGVKAVWRSIERNIALRRPYEAARVFVDYWSGKGTFMGMSPEGRERLSGLIKKVPWDFHALFNADISTRTIADLGLPVLLMHGGKTHGIVKHIVKLLHANTPQLKGRCFADAGHLSPMRTPDLVLPDVMAFLGRTIPEASLSVDSQ